jgi:hypothetical protein
VPLLIVVGAGMIVHHVEKVIMDRNQISGDGVVLESVDIR